MSSYLTRSLGFEAVSTGAIKMQDSRILCDATSTLRRTLSVSADIPSEKWIAKSGLKKVDSVDNLHYDNNDTIDSNKAFEDIWNSIQREEEEEKPRLQSSDIWSSILSQKDSNQEEGNNGSVPPPYIHPLVRRSASTLSEKSLEICTESLGSETGSDGFSFLSDSDKDETKAEEVVEDAEEEVVHVVPAAAVAPVMAHQQQPLKKVTSVRSFPPPLPTLAHRGDGSNVQMRSHREDGRLVLEAVSVPTHACFRAERQDGRLLLMFSPGSETEPEAEQQDEEEVVCDEFDKVGDVVEDEDEEEDHDSDWEEEEEEDRDYENQEVVVLNKEEFATRREYSVVANKFLGLTRSFPRRLNMVVTTLEEDEAGESYMQLNTYVYSWRSKPEPAVKLLQVDHRHHHYGKSAVVEVVVDATKSGKAGEDDLIPMFMKRCNLQQQLPKKSTLQVMWDHRCIAAT